MLLLHAREEICGQHCLQLQVGHHGAARRTGDVSSGTVEERANTGQQTRLAQFAAAHRNQQVLWRDLLPAEETRRGIFWCWCLILVSFSIWVLARMMRGLLQLVKVTAVVLQFERTGQAISATDRMEFRRLALQIRQQERPGVA